jgi:hypothetical protein
VCIYIYIYIILIVTLLVASLGPEIGFFKRTSHKTILPTHTHTQSDAYMYSNNKRYSNSGTEATAIYTLAYKSQVDMFARRVVIKFVYVKIQE